MRMELYTEEDKVINNLLDETIIFWTSYGASSFAQSWITFKFASIGALAGPIGIGGGIIVGLAVDDIMHRCLKWSRRFYENE